MEQQMQHGLSPAMAPFLSWFAPKQSAEAKLAEYQQALNAMDWQYQFTDDHTVFQAGVRKLERAIELQKVVDPTGEIWMRHPMAQRHGAPRPVVQGAAA